MIELFAGRIGGFKTYNAVIRCMQQMGNGGTVCTNIKLVEDEVRKHLLKRYAWEYDPEQYVYLDEIEKCYNWHRHTPRGTKDNPVLVIIDEAHIYMNAREWKQNQARSKELFEFLTQSRKHATDCIFITQAVENLDGQVARLALYTWTFRDLQTWKLDFKLFKLKYPFPQYLVQQWDYTGKDCFDRRFEVKDKAIFPLYDTTQMIREIDRKGVAKKLERSELAERRLKVKRRNLYLTTAVISTILVLGLIGCVTTRKSEKVVEDPEQEKRVTAVNTGNEKENPNEKIRYVPITSIVDYGDGRAVAHDATGNKYELGAIDIDGYRVYGISEQRIVMVNEQTGEVREIRHVNVRGSNDVESSEANNFAARR